MKLANRHVDAIAELIAARSLSAGDYIGTEQDIAELLSSSRWTVREALNILAREGRIEIRRGRQGGIYVAEPNPESVSMGLRSYLEFLRVSNEQIGQARAVLDHAVLVLALQRLRTADVVRLRSAGDIESPEYGLEAGFIQYDALLTAAGNPVLKALVRAVGQLGISALLRSSLSGSEIDDALRRVRRLRREQIEAVIAGRLERSLATEARILAINEGLLGSVTSHARDGEPTSVPDALELLRSSRRFKRPELLMQQIAAEVVTRQWPVGERLGSEAELLERFGVGRAAFREAVRALERIGVVTMQTGRNSGLKVASPNPENIVAAAADQFKAMGTSPATVVEALYHLSAGALDFVPLGDAERILVGPASLTDVMYGIAKMSSNPILALFAEVCRRTLGQWEVECEPSLIDVLHRAFESGDRALAARALLEAAALGHSRQFG